MTIKRNRDGKIITHPRSASEILAGYNITPAEIRRVERVLAKIERKNVKATAKKSASSRRVAS